MVVVNPVAVSTVPTLATTSMIHHRVDLLSPVILLFTRLYCLSFEERARRKSRHLERRGSEGIVES